VAMGSDDPTSNIGNDACREPTAEDLAKLCHALNEAGARYVVVGGFAIRAAGYIRSTMDVDLLVETGPENESKVLAGLMVLPDKAARFVQPGDISQYTVVRIADEILVDLMKTSCGVTYSEAVTSINFHEVNGVRIPFASPDMMWKMKQTMREKDISDRLFLSQLLNRTNRAVTGKPDGSQSEVFFSKIGRWFKGK
jgi:hypothetical protein